MLVQFGNIKKKKKETKAAFKIPFSKFIASLSPCILLKNRHFIFPIVNLMSHTVVFLKASVEFCWTLRTTNTEPWSPYCCWFSAIAFRSKVVHECIKLIEVSTSLMFPLKKRQFQKASPKKITSRYYKLQLFHILFILLCSCEVSWNEIGKNDLNC